MRDPGGSTLSGLLRARGAFDDPTAAYYAACAVLALERVRQRGGVYGSLDPEHLLLDHMGRGRLADSALPTENPGYMAPEIVMGGRATVASDHWALGVLVFELLVGAPPFEARSEDPHNTFRRIVSGRFYLPPHVLEKAADLMHRLLVVDPAQRLGSGIEGAGEIRRHEWFADLDWPTLEAGELLPPDRSTIAWFDNDAYFTTPN